MSEINLSVTFPKIDPTNLADFKKHASTAMDLAKSEPDTLQYDWFFNDDETVCVLKERYPNSAALLTHLGNVGPHLGPLLAAAGSVEIDLLGDPSPELAEALKGLNPTIYRPFTG